MFNRRKLPHRTVSFESENESEEPADGLTAFLRSWVYEKAAKLIQGAQADRDDMPTVGEGKVGTAGIMHGTFQGKPCYYLAVAERENDGTPRLAVEPIALVLMPEHFENGMVGGPTGAAPTRCNPDGTPVVTH